MAKKETKEKSIEETLWQSCDKLRGSVEPAEYKHVVLGLIFLKFASDKLEERRKELIEEGKEKYVEMKDFYTMKNVFFLDEISRWSYIIKNAKQNDISLKIDTALNTIEKNNPALKGALPDNYFSSLALDKTKLASLLDTVNDIDTLKDDGQDVIGRVYEYFLGKFALKESSGKGKGEFYTPKTIVNLIAELIEPYKGIIYDPCCGTGGMFVQSIKFIENHQGTKKEVSIYGQENTPTTYKLAKMNLAIRGISANLGEKHVDTFANDQHKDLKADYIMANPPFNLKDWRGENELLDDPRWMGYEVPPKSNANYGWILNMVSKLSENGVAGFILANGALSGGGEEYKIRRKLIENNLVEAIIIIPRNTFYTTDISVTLWVLNKNKKERTAHINSTDKNYRNREKEILFMDLRRWGSEYEKKYVQLAEQDIENVALNYHNWQQVDFETMYKDVPEFCKSASFEDIVANNFSLVPSKYIEFVDKDNGIDFDTEMKRIQKDFTTLLQEEKESQNQLINAFKVLGNPIDKLHLNKLETILKVEDVYDSNELQSSKHPISLSINKIINECSIDNLHLKIYELKELFNNSIIEDDEKKLTLDELEDFENQLIQYKKQNLRPSLDGFKSAIALGLTNNSSGKDNGVCLSTVHTMKGQESEIVFLIGMDDGTFPDFRAINKGGEELQQEKNNAYVAFTRAKRFLFITYPKKRLMPWGGYKTRVISRFLKPLI